MPIYDQMSGPRVDPGRRPRKTRDFSATGPRRRLHLAFVCQRTFCDLLNYLAARLRASGWSPQIPAVHAKERDEEVIRAWLDWSSTPR